ncbi:MAG: Protein lysine acetyltransferase Pat (EC [uncultured Paraburkholderia sp.]|uniref:bifunctional acetate--CoA ligase family protein/GNAT family N-acetyltransferase n=1 Tax=uncultured Paraburkholderia sp. TaxID=1822466 RepID=UPI002595301C|nr:GNAT family N-acetyltransferase [uncultured Paraburkholderia sp.]CAH2902838.1 MAG: Protein lysine acetyltransferase Pat (EC [uncultured Paraburkholderia sp.]CAH2937973.1 MAG: Protein lysine acetyltransferase Pat (EC [uncultured Paraburkholderia sp.]
MTVRNLDALFRPRSVAVIGASERPGSTGAMVWARLLEGGFEGPLWPVNPRYETLSGHPVIGDVGDLPQAPTVALICTPAASWPSIIHKLGGLGTRAAIIVGEMRCDDDRLALRHALAAARPHLLRIVGPGSLGVVTPALRAHFGAPSCTVKAGGVAWVSQSNALTNAVLGWAHARGLGFSHAIALGGEADVDAGDVLDYLASDPGTRAILLELDSVKAARKFMSAARAAARNKPVLALRSGRADPADGLYTAAFRRAGMVRVDALDDLLDEIETLGVGRVAAGATATLITSDRGLATLACDAFAAAGDTLAPWPEQASQALHEALPHAVGGNPLQLGDDARPEHFGTALKLLAEHRGTGTAFVVHASTHGAPVGDVAQALIENQRYAYRGLLACFFGGLDAATRDALHAQGIPVHTTPQRLARAFARLVDYRMGRELLMQTPEGLPAEVPDAIDAAQAQARAALAAGERELTGEAAADLLKRFGLDIETVPTANTAGAGERPDAAQSSRESDCAGTDAASERKPVVDIAVELDDDDNFGPVFRFTAPSADGVSEPLRLYGLPPLNPTLARDIVTRSPYARLIAPEPALAALTALSQAVCDVREIVGLTLTLRVYRDHVTVVAPTLRIAPTRSRLAIMPYPRRFEETLDWQGLRITVRPIRPEDEAAHHDFVEAMTPEDLRLRFFGAVGSFDHSQLARMTQIDYDREMALIATVQSDEGLARTLGVVRAVADPDNETAEFAVAIRSDQKGRRLGRLLTDRIIRYARARGIHWLVGEALRENTAMIALARASGFTITPTEDPSVVGFRMALEKEPEQEKSAATVRGAR